MDSGSRALPHLGDAALVNGRASFEFVRSSHLCAACLKSHIVVFFFSPRVWESSRLWDLLYIGPSFSAVHEVASPTGIYVGVFW